MDRQYNPPVTLCINGCRLSSDPKVCVHTNPGFPRRVEPVSRAEARRLEHLRQPKPRVRGDLIPPVSDYAHWNEDAEAMWYEENKYDMQHWDEPIEDDPEDDFNWHGDEEELEDE